MNERDSGGASLVRNVLYENGKTYFYLDSKSPTSSSISESSADRLISSPEMSDDSKLRQLIQLVEPLKGPLRFSEDNGEQPREANDSQHMFGEHMIVRNAREMFENVDILTDGRYFCRVCNRTYKTHATLTAHLRGCHLRQESPCGEKGCNYVSYTEHERRKHQKMHDKTKTKKHLRIQKSIMHLPFPGEAVLREQILRNNEDIPGMAKAVDDSGRGKVKYTCQDCNQTFWNTYRAIRHIEVHRNAPKRCYYCGEIRRGIMDLQVHYMRTHKNEGVHTFTCCTCNRGFTSVRLLEKHADPQECEHACLGSEMRQHIYYGELPLGVTIDQKTQNRLNFFRKRNDEMEAREQLSQTDAETVQMATDDVAPIVATESDLDIFDEANSLIQTEFGLKKLADYKMSSQFRFRPANRVIDSRGGGEANGESAARKERVLIAQNGYYEHQESQSQQQNNTRQFSECGQNPPSYGCDPLFGRYTDFHVTQDVQQHNYHHYGSPSNFPTFPESYNRNHEEYSDQMDRGNGRTDSMSMFPMPDSSSKTNDMVNELLVGDGKTDTVFEELDKLNFGMPLSNENDCDEDLTDLFNF